MGKCTSSIPPDHNTVVPFSGTKYVNRNVKSKPQINTRKIKKSRLKEEAKLKAIREKEVADAKRRAVEEKERQKRIEKERLRQKKLEQERLDREKREREKRQREKAARNARLDKEPNSTRLAPLNIHTGGYIPKIQIDALEDCKKCVKIFYNKGQYSDEHKANAPRKLVQIYIRTYIMELGRSGLCTIDCECDTTILEIKLKVRDKTAIPERKQRFTWCGKQLSNSRTLWDYGISSSHCRIDMHLSLSGGGLIYFRYDAHKDTFVVGRDDIEISSFHVSCKSDRINGENMAGIVLYSRNDQNQWSLNGIRCKSGYIILKSVNNIKLIKSSQGQVHGKCYKSIFGCEIDETVVGGGFAFVNGQWKFNSYSFNVASKYHDNKKAMNLLEQQCILVAMDNWRKGVQKTSCSAIRKTYNGYCMQHNIIY
eukprot:155602_1